METLNKDSIDIKQVEFSVLETGDNFYLSRFTAIDGISSYKKIDSIKNDRGIWANTKSHLGTTQFTKYDQKVWIKK